MDFHQYVREQLPSLLTPREPEILEELAHHLEDLYREGRSAGFDHEAALARATRALTASLQTASDIRSSSRAPFERLLDRVHATLDEPVSRAPQGSRSSRISGAISVTASGRSSMLPVLPPSWSSRWASALVPLQ